ncbi:hypothetical protein LCGC14_2199630 [marine sediment metagenome]|uniref:Uncharacterized protein n=1 Tax=marine sediment metagenome TaxID=412755 RepID=A0A0F9FUG1_9ZZZZ
MEVTVNEKETNEDIESAEESIKKGFTLIENYEIIDNMPPIFQKVREGKEEIIKFFDKLPGGKIMRIKFPNEYLWKTYFTALRYYASNYSFDMQFNKRKDEGGYFLYIRKLRREKDEENCIGSVGCDPARHKRLGRRKTGGGGYRIPEDVLPGRCRWIAGQAHG